MIIKIVSEAGYEESLLGLSLSYNQPRDKMDGVSRKIYNKGGGHNKFLETMIVWLDITAARYWWQQFDTYRIGITKQSESTMHTILKKPLSQDNFEGGIFPDTVARLNRLVEAKDFAQLKRELPESFLQRRVVCSNYQTLRRMIEQRRHHKLEEWKLFCRHLREKLQHPEYLEDVIQ
jgi:hypothetical protein